MEEKERDEVLIRLDERTERIDANLDQMDDRIVENRERIGKLDDRVQANEQDLSVAKKAIGGLMALLAGAVGKLLGWLRI